MWRTLLHSNRWSLTQAGRLLHFLSYPLLIDFWRVLLSYLYLIILFFLRRGINDLLLLQGTGISVLEFVGIREEYFISGIPLCKLKSKALSKWDNCQTICMTVKMEQDGRDCKSGYLLEMPQILSITNAISSELIPGAALKSMEFFRFSVTAVASKTDCNFLMQEMLPPRMIYACLDYGLCPSVLTGFLSSPVQTALNPLHCCIVVNVDEGLWDTSRCDLFISCCDSSDVADGEEMSSVQSGCSFPACVSGKELLEVVRKLSLGSCCFPEIER